jgi:hypothetical protein
VLLGSSFGIGTRLLVQVLCCRRVGVPEQLLDDLYVLAFIR